MKKRLKKIKHKIIGLFSQGLSVKKIAESLIFSGLLTVIPVFGISTLLITVVSVKRKLNLPIMVAFSYVMWPLQILLLVPFIKLGEFLFSIPSTNHSIDKIIAFYNEGFVILISQLFIDLLCALAAWFLIAVPFSFGLYWITLLILKIISKKETVL
jgi:hypothetical protein